MNIDPKVIDLKDTAEDILIWHHQTETKSFNPAFVRKIWKLCIKIIEGSTWKVSDKQVSAIKNIHKSWKVGKWLGQCSPDEVETMRSDYMEADEKGDFKEYDEED